MKSNKKTPLQSLSDKLAIVALGEEVILTKSEAMLYDVNHADIFGPDDELNEEADDEK